METVVANLRIKTALRNNTPASKLWKAMVGDSVLAYSEEANAWKGAYRVMRVVDKQVCVPIIEHHTQKCNVRSIKLNIGEREYDYQTQEDLPKELATSCERFAVIPNEILHSLDPGCFAERFREAKQKEIKGLKELGTFTVASESDILKDANDIGGRFFLTLNDVNYPDKTAKARYVAVGHRDKDMAMLVRYSLILGQASTRSVMTTADLDGYRIWLHDRT